MGAFFVQLALILHIAHVYGALLSRVVGQRPAQGQAGAR
jgi:hypothetical protein